jgi:hypothetical protein
MSTIADYAGRTYDVCAFQGQRPRGEALLDQTLIGGGGAICTSIAKAAQRWTVEFLTERGSVAYRPDRGCDFMTKLRLGYLRHESDVFAAFALANADVIDGLADDEADDTPDDERIASASLVRVQIHPGYCNLKVALTTVAGPRREVILPVATS